MMKSRLTIENYSGYSVEAILQDIHAKTLSKNITAIAILEASPRKDKTCQNRDLSYSVNFTYALSQLKDNVVRIIMNIAPKNLVELLINKIAKVLSARRPNRKFERPHKRMIKEKYPPCYKRFC